MSVCQEGPTTHHHTFNLHKKPQQVIYDNTPWYAFLTSLAAPILYVYSSTKAPDPAKTQDELKHKSKKAEQMLKQLTKEEESHKLQEKKKVCF
jgi:hypothetical protein